MKRGNAGAALRSTNSVLVKPLAQARPLQDQVASLVLIFFFSQRRVGAQLRVSYPFDEFIPAARPMDLADHPMAVLTGQGAGNGGDRALAAAPLGDVPENLYSTIACSTKVSSASRSETVAIEPSPVFVAREQRGRRGDGDIDRRPP